MHNVPINKELELSFRCENNQNRIVLTRNGINAV
jgi:hypothetical protein